MNRSSHVLRQSGFVPDGGRPGCPACGRRLAFGTDGQGRGTESCACGYRGYVVVRPQPAAAKPAKC